MSKNKLYRKLEEISTKKGIIILFVTAHLTLLAMMLFTFPRINAKMQTQAFDLKTFGYSTAEALDMIGKLDQATIDFYIFPQLFLLDLLYPFLLAMFLSGLMVRLFNLTAIKSEHLFSNAFMLPFVAMCFDYLENISICFMISGGGDPSEGLIQAASFFTSLKSGFTIISWIIILILFVVYLKNRRLSRKTNRAQE